MARHGTGKVAIRQGLGIRDWGFALVATLAATVALANAQVDPQPTFRSEIDYVQIPVRVVDTRGEFVRGLTQSDFQILEDGQPQTITAFNAVDIPFIRRRAAVATGGARIAANETVISNESLQVDGRVYVFILDNQTMDAATALRTRHVMRRFLDDGFAANDIAAVVFTGAGRGQSFTQDRRLLDATLARFMSDADPTDNEFHRVTRVITEAARSMGAIKGRRKALVLVTASAICQLSASECRESIDDALRASIQSDVSVYTIDPAGLNAYQRTRAEHANPNSSYGDKGYAEAGNAAAARAAFGGARAEFHGPLSGARYLADASGGFAVVNTNNLNQGWARVVRENSSYYLLGYYSSNNRADGRARRNEVKVARPGAAAMYRAGYFAPAHQGGVKVSRTSASSTTPSVDEQLQELADNPLPVSTMPLRVTATPVASSDGPSSVDVMVEIPAGALTLADGPEDVRHRVRLSIGFYDRNGNSVAGEDPTIDVAGAHSDAIRFMSRIAVPPGTYRLWVGAVQIPTGVRGSVMTDMTVPVGRRIPRSAR